MIEAMVYLMILIVIKIIEWTCKIFKYVFVGILNLIIISFQLSWWIIKAIIGGLFRLITNASHSPRKKKLHYIHLNKKQAGNDDLDWIDELEELDAILDD